MQAGILVGMRPSDKTLVAVSGMQLMHWSGEAEGAYEH